MGRRRSGNPTPQNTNSSIGDLLENEESELSVPDPNRTMINITKDLNGAHKRSLKEEMMNKIIEKLMKML
jgi:hypothetical protein